MQAQVISGTGETVESRPSTWDVQAGARHASERVSHAVRRAEALIAAHPDAPFTADSLAEAVGVSTRSLSRGFQGLRGYSPMAAVRRARLERVRLDLLAAASDESVTDAAMRWGFFHLGRFSRLYASHFGELPSATRRRGRAPRPPGGC